MFRKSNKEPQLDAFMGVPSMLENTAYKLYSDDKHWHNLFRDQVVNRIDDSIFSPLFNHSMGAPNAPIPVVVGMMILKESFCWSDSQLFEHCRFNLLIRSALGLFNLNDPLPVESTYYLFRKRLHDYGRTTGEDLMGKVFTKITSQQVKEFDVNGHSIRMDSKLIGSNIALYSRYEIIHHTLTSFYKSIRQSTASSRISGSDTATLESLCGEEPQKIVYRSSREELKSRFQPIGILIYKLVQLFSDLQSDSFKLLERVFNEQFKVSEQQQVELRPKEEISSSSVQSPHDPDSTYRNKGEQKVKGFTANITETCSDDPLNLITSVIIDKANKPDSEFVEPAIGQTIEVTSQKVKKAYTDGGYQSPANNEVCKDIDMVYTGIQGAEPRYDLEMIDQQLMVMDTQTGEYIRATPIKRRKSGSEQRWRIVTSEGYRYHYFGQTAIRAAALRKQMKTRPPEELHKRNNVEATIFLFGIPLRNHKSKYRGLIAQKTWAYCRCLWINLIRICNYTKQICQRTIKKMESSFCLGIFKTFYPDWEVLQSNYKEMAPLFFPKHINQLLHC